MKKLSLSLMLIIGLSGCQTSPIPVVKKKEPVKVLLKPLVEKPQTLLVLPLINNTKVYELDKFFPSTLISPLAEKGYYPLSPMAIQTQQKVTPLQDSWEIKVGTSKHLRQQFLVDAVFIPQINTWRSKNQVVTAHVDFVIKSTKTDAILWQYRGELTFNPKAEHPKDWNEWFTDNQTKLSHDYAAMGLLNLKSLTTLPQGKIKPKKKPPVQTSQASPSD